MQRFHELNLVLPHLVQVLSIYLPISTKRPIISRQCANSCKGVRSTNLTGNSHPNSLKPPYEKKIHFTPAFLLRFVQHVKTRKVIF